MKANNIICQNISLQTCVEIQECFLLPDRPIPIYSPFENTSSSDQYFKLAIIGEIGSLLNLYCKQQRKYKTYQLQIINEAADIFIYFLIMILRYQDNKKTILEFENKWHDYKLMTMSEEEFNSIISKLIEQIMGMDARNYHNLAVGIFDKVVYVGQYASNSSWTKIIDSFHDTMLLKHLDNNNYATNFLYKGHGYVNLPKLLNIIKAEIASGKIVIEPKFFSNFENLVNQYLQQNG